MGRSKAVPVRRRCTRSSSSSSDNNNDDIASDAAARYCPMPPSLPASLADTQQKNHNRRRRRPCAKSEPRRQQENETATSAFPAVQPNLPCLRQHPNNNGSLKKRILQQPQQQQKDCLECGGWYSTNDNDQQQPSSLPPPTMVGWIAHVSFPLANLTAAAATTTTLCTTTSDSLTLSQPEQQQQQLEQKQVMGGGRIRSQRNVRHVAEAALFPNRNHNDDTNDTAILLPMMEALERSVVTAETIWLYLEMEKQTQSSSDSSSASKNDTAAAAATLVSNTSQCNSNSRSSSSSPSGSGSGGSVGVLHVGLTPRAFECCHPDTLVWSSQPHHYRQQQQRGRPCRTTSNSSMAAAAAREDVQLVLAALFPHSEIATIQGRRHTTTTGTANVEETRAVTAQQVYSVLDNVQLDKVMTCRSSSSATASSSASSSRTGTWAAASTNQDSGMIATTTDNTHHRPCDIPGLVPTLRPYQAAAVEWMIQRETNTAQKENSEWELAWVVLVVAAAAAPPPLQCHRNDTVDMTRSTHNTSVVPLPEWKAKHIPAEAAAWDGSSIDNIDISSSRNRLVLYCPFTGWLATSIEQAHRMTVGTIVDTTTDSFWEKDFRLGDNHDAATTIPNDDCSNNYTRGGILAESMGLGKTVEVLACILAHPYVGEPTQSPTGKDSLLSPRNAETKVALSDGENRNHSYESETEPETANHVPIRNPASLDCATPNFHDTIVPALSPTNVANDESTTAIEVGCTVAPDERFWDGDVLGSCICGELIGFSTGKDGLRLSVIICRHCDGPMHMHCATFSSTDEMNLQTTPLRIRRSSTRDFLDCRVCHRDRCPCCVAPMVSGATLIVTPPAILSQWEREIHRHTRGPNGKPLQVVVYDGIKRLSQNNSVANGCTSIKYMHPSFLAKSDIVLMTFETLLSDLGHTDDNQYITRGSTSNSGGNLRKRKRYRVVPSPLLAIQWWRICLDEAQRVETPTAGSAQMARKLVAQNRWCMSGTPVGRGKLDDLYGLLLFLRLDPFCDKAWFRRCFNPAYRNIAGRIKHLLANIAWRSTKKNELVREQMGIPEQIERKIFLEFSSIEKHFYQRQLERTLSAAGEVADREKHSKKSSSRVLLLTDHLHKLRAACCHPQVGSSGIGSLKRSKTKTNEGDGSVRSRVMTMPQILDRLIDDAKNQCEESLRLAILHTNGMAVMSKLKVEAKQRGVVIFETDHDLLRKSCDLYAHSIQLADENAVPTLIVGESTITGSSGFCAPRKNDRSGRLSFAWVLAEPTHDCNIWSKFEFFSGPARKILQLRARARSTIPSSLVGDDEDSEYDWQVVFPKDCTLQCLSSLGEFVDVHSFSMPFPSSPTNNAWVTERGFRSNKSKSWRLVVKSTHSKPIGNGDRALISASCRSFACVEIEVFEAAVASDPLQRLHCLHNASLSFSSLLQFHGCTEQNGGNISSDDIRTKVDSMLYEARKIETLYLLSVRAIHNNYHRRLEEAFSLRHDLERDLKDLSGKESQTKNTADWWDDTWWDDFLVMCHLYGSDAQQRAVYERMTQELDELQQGGVESAERVGHVPFPLFRDIVGLRIAFQMRISHIRSGLGSKSSRRSQTSPSSSIGKTKDSSLFTFREGRFKCGAGSHSRCMRSILALTDCPSDGEMMENSRCKICKADWYQTGPKCRHCAIGEELEDLAPDKVTMLVLTTLHSILRGNIGTSIVKAANTTATFVDRAKTFFNILEAAKKERTEAWRLWRTHLDLLNDLDELSQCKSVMRLTLEDEDVTALTQDQLNSVVVPIDACSRYHEHAAKQAMALGALSRAKGTLQYLKNQNAAENIMSNNEKEAETCMVCLGTFNVDRAVLRCGHSFHWTPCLEKLQSSRNSGGTTSIRCPLRCSVRTDPKDVLIALSEGKRHDDGSRSLGQVRGSYGTKVTRLVSDILDVCGLGEKSLIFSQWDDMLVICEEALGENDVSFVRVGSLKQIGDCTRRFREPDCSVMLLNVKNGAEGLTLVEATHVFMIEPLLNCGLDIQAINRTHRIGQSRKTYVWRYIVNDTVEVKIDKLRMAQQEDQLEDLVSEGKKSVFQAGGIDGGFRSSAELMDMLQP